LVSPVTVFGEHAADDAGEFGWRFTERFGLGGGDGDESCSKVVAGKGAAAAEHFVEDGAEAEDVAAGIDGFALGLLGGHVGSGAGDFAFLADGGGLRLEPVRRAGQELGKAEIEDLDAAVAVDEDVVGFQVAVDDAGLVGGGESVADLDGVAEGIGGWKRAREGSAFDILHDEVWQALVVANFIESADVGMVEGGDGAGFAFEALGEAGVDQFDGDGAAEAGIAGAVHTSHTALAELIEDAVV
jgi:hypothetical protein